MQIDLNDPSAFTLDNFRLLIASGNDSVATQIRVTKGGVLFLSVDVTRDNVDELLFRLESFVANNGYVGPEAAKDDKLVKRLYKCVKANYPDPISEYIDIF